jgi:hypothetical protein
MKISDLTSFVTSLNDAQKAINTRRDLWNSQTKDLIHFTLEKVRNEYSIGWITQIFGDKNLQTITLKFEKVELMKHS